MRGKDLGHLGIGSRMGITPAYAGKSDVVNYNIDLT